MGGKRFAAAMALACVASGAAAEAVRIAALRAPASREVAMARSLAIGRIGGRDGAQLGLALERALSGAGIGGQPWFDVLAGRRGEDRADMILDGVAETDVDEGRIKLKRQRCIEGTDDKCAKRGEVELDCTSRTINVVGDLRVVDGEAGRVAWSERKQRSDQTSWCPGDSRPAGVEQVVARLLGSMADEVAGELAPRDSNDNVRFREGRRGMDKATGERFKVAIRLTQRDLPAACAEFAAMPDHPSTLFNRALCAEARGDHAGAEKGFADLAQTDRDGDVRDSLARVRGTMMVRELIAARR
ncbi:hypothetical protein [Sphingomonas sp. Y38-1Y]|uniref:hypothetical protein n=1 Tax=Sphingomonas sp. Y38-1Y TaxID=3078265 RepID=UPI0028E596BD|nr:hypothetical protein [Sphingomonas sp. Y38-1Y]